MFGDSIGIKNSRQGFTLAELIVAMSVFIVAMIIVVGSFIRVIRTQRAVNNLLSMNSNMSLVIELITRDIRTGYNFSLNSLPGGSCIGSQVEELEFTNTRFNSVFYHDEGGAVVRRECAGEDCTGKDFEALTASNVNIERLCFLNTGNLENGKDPWRITLFFKVGSADLVLSSQVIDLQTTIAARITPQETE